MSLQILNLAAVMAEADHSRRQQQQQEQLFSKAATATTTTATTHSSSTETSPMVAPSIATQSPLFTALAASRRSQWSPSNNNKNGKNTRSTNNSGCESPNQSKNAISDHLRKTSAGSSLGLLHESLGVGMAHRSSSSSSRDLDVESLLLRAHQESKIRSLLLQRQHQQLSSAATATATAPMPGLFSSSSAVAAALGREQQLLRMGLTNSSIVNNSIHNRNSSSLLPPSALLYSRLGLSNLIHHSPSSVATTGNIKEDERIEGRPEKTKPSTITKVLAMDCDSESLSEYQCLIRKQMELFEASPDDAACSVQGRNKPIAVRQVGIRCRHCQSCKGNLYFPTKLGRIYQAAQNLATFHLIQGCPKIPKDVRDRIAFLKEKKSPAGGGKAYWSEGVRCLGVTEKAEGGLFFVYSNTK